MMQGSQSGKQLNNRLRSTALRLALLGLVLVGVLFITVVGNFLLKRVELPGTGLRYLFLIVLVVLLILDLGIRYIQFSFGLADYRTAFLWFLSSVGLSEGLALKVWDTNLKPTSIDEPNPIRTIGGPGKLSIPAGLAVLVESLDGTLKVYGKGDYQLGRLDRLKVVVKLGDVTDKIDKKSVTTRDGITVDVSDIRFRYRVLQTDKETLENSIKRLAYNMALDDKGEANWHAAVGRTVSSVITGVISENILDYSTAPFFGEIASKKFSRTFNRNTHQQSRLAPRQNIQGKFDQKGRDQLREIGAELLWYDMGHFSLPEEVLALRAETWQKIWKGNLDIYHVLLEESRYEERRKSDEGRFKAQARLITSIVKGLDDIISGSSDPAAITPNVNVFLTAVTELLSELGKATLSDWQEQKPE